MADPAASAASTEGFNLDDPTRAACAVGSLVDAIETIAAAAGVTVMVDLSRTPLDAHIIAAEIVHVIEDLRSTAGELEPNEENDHA